MIFFKDESFFITCHKETTAKEKDVHQRNQRKGQSASVTRNVPTEVGINYSRLFSEIDRLMSTVSRLMSRNVIDGYLFVTKEASVPCPMAMTVPIGSVSVEKVSRLFTLATENALRLRDEYPEHRTSFESRDPRAQVFNVIDDIYRSWGKWGGAIRAGGYILSFSGLLDEWWDEALVSVLAIRYSLVEENELLNAISEKRNPHLRPLLEACR